MATEKGRAARPSLKVSLCCETKSNQNRVQNLGSDQLNNRLGYVGNMEEIHHLWDSLLKQDLTMSPVLLLGNLSYSKPIYTLLSSLVI